MPELTRREFIKYSSLAVAGLGLSSCAVSKTEQVLAAASYIRSATTPSKDAVSLATWSLNRTYAAGQWTLKDIHRICREEFDIDGVIELRQLYSFPREFRFTLSVERLKEAGIPHLFLRIEYHLAGVGMLTTRVEAFLEMLRWKAPVGR